MENEGGGTARDFGNMLNEHKGKKKSKKKSAEFSPWTKIGKKTKGE